MGDEANRSFNESQSLQLRGILNLAALEKGLQALVQRHEALRTTISPDGNTLCIAVSLKIEIPFLDLTDLPQSEVAERLSQRKRQAVEYTFDLEKGPLFRAEIIRTGDQEHTLILSAHHIICDGWSWGVLVPDLGKLYTAFCLGVAPTLEKQERFSDYARMEQQRSNTPEANALESFWVKQFADSTPVVDFPTDHPRPPVRTFQSERVDHEIDGELVAGLKALAKTLGCSFMTVLLSGFEIWLYRLTRQRDLVVGVPAAGQASAGMYNLVGHCVNLLPLRCQIDPERSFADYARARKSQLLDAYDHQQLGFGNLLSKLALPRDSSRIPLVPITFNLDRGLEKDRLSFIGLDGEFFSNPRTYENFEMFLNATELDNKLVLECQYNSNLFDAATISRRLEEWEVLLRGIIAEPDRPLAGLPLLTATEREWLERWNRTETPYPRDRCVHELFEEQAARTPDAIAVIFASEQLTYKELDERATRLASYLQKLGVKSETLVGFCLDRSLHAIVAILSILKAGGAYVPIDPTYPLERQAFMVEDSGVAIVLTQNSLKAQLPAGRARVICLDSEWAASEALSADWSSPRAEVTPVNLAYVMYTSGSTGQPKGVNVLHRGIVRLVKSNNYADFGGEQTFLQLAPLAFDASTFEIWGALLNGGRLVIFLPGKPSLDEIEGALQKYRVTTLWLTAALFHLMVEERVEALGGLHQLIAGGDILSVSQVSKYQRAFPACRLINGYGPTENTVFTCCYSIGKTGELDSSIPIGRPLANTRVYVLDSFLQPVPIGVPGELYIGGDGLARGYLNRLELTRERFIAAPFLKEGERLYKTGDIVRYREDGNLEFIGRADNQIKIRGFRIELGEIEATLLQHPAIEEAIVIVQPDIRGEKAIVGYFVPRKEQTQKPQDDNEAKQLIAQLRTFLKVKIPDYMIPAALVALESMPLTPNGKVDRSVLPIPPTIRPATGERQVKPLTPTQLQVVQIWEEILLVKNIGINDNFFELGGHSLLGTQIVARLSRIFAVKIPLGILFQFPTIAELTQRIETLGWVTRSFNAEPIITTEDYEEGEI
jgi:amino acid adenylation domain-containing protein